MTDKKFNAILGKNEIAKEVTKLQGELVKHKLNYLLNTHFILECLRDIEKFTGQGNQPSIDDIIK